MGFLSYEGVPDSVLDEVHETSTGEYYTMRHNPELKVEMQFLGKGKNNANAQGWERSSDKYFNELLQQHPEMFSKKNITRIQQKCAPIVDQKMIDHNPQWTEYRNQPLIHHHIGGNGEAVAVPQNMHKGSGEIHNFEKSAGITDRCKSFSSQCGKMTESEGVKTSELHSRITKLSDEQTTITDEKSARSESVYNAIDSKNSHSYEERIQSVENSLSSSNSSLSARNNSVETAIHSNHGDTQSNNATQNQGNTNGVSQNH